jgi:uncharacterized NAD-dependent epimerase/dehydratase family protein
MEPIRIPQPTLLFLGDANDRAAKTAHGIFYWRPERCVGVLRLPGGTASLALPELTVQEAAARGAGSMIIGVANTGGFVPERWHPAIIEALEAGLDVAAGLHDRLNGIPVLRETAERCGRRLYDVRHPEPGSIPIAKAHRRTGKRLLTVGTDCAVGKMYTALALERELRNRGVAADFRATGQTGIFIAGSGISVDAVVSDFVAGAAEVLTPDNAEDHWDLVEGQGSLFHPAYAGVTLGLIHGSQPDALVVCHDAARKRIDDYEDYGLPSIREVIDLCEYTARRTNPAARAVGISINTSKLSPDAARAYVDSVQTEISLPTTDPVRYGVGRLVDSLLS